MGKNLCPENEITFETSYQIKFETPIPPGTYTCSAVIDSTIEAGDQMTAYEPYGYEPEPEPEPEDSKKHEAEIAMYYAALAGEINIDMLPGPSCRETMLIRKLLEPDYELPIFLFDSRVEMYLLDLIHGTTTMLTNVPKLDKEKYLHKAIGGTVEEMPNPNACSVNYWMNAWITNKGV